MNVLTTPDQMEMARLLTLRSMLKLEMLGMSRSKSPSAYSILKKEYGCKGSREKVMQELNAWRDELLNEGESK
jgi:hypothetical protein